MNRTDPTRTRSAGLLLHPTSLPGSFGVGDLGPAAYQFVDFLSSAGQTWWQMLPVGPVGAGHSPYDSPSTFAGSPLLISPEMLVDQGLLDADTLDAAPAALAKPGRARYPQAARFKDKLLLEANARFFSRPRSNKQYRGFEAFCERNRYWIDDYALFAALRDVYADVSWPNWDTGLAQRKPGSLDNARREHSEAIRHHQFVQYLFDAQWQALREYARARDVLLFGDLPMFVKHDGADAWAFREAFELDRNGQRRTQAGVPPDYFSRTGQLWGNPLYDWKSLQSRDFEWWIERLRKNLDRFDVLRIDHFIGLHRCWKVPATAKTALKGKFELVPGAKLLERARQEFGSLPIIAEDLGTVTPEVHALRNQFDLPGMRVLMFAFGDPVSDYQPHRFDRRSVVYTGTHDNDTLMGWFKASPPRGKKPAEAHRAERRRALAYAGSTGSKPHWDFIRLGLMSVADLAMFPVQDILGLGTQARMNVPGTPSGNWTWRLQPGALTGSVAERLLALSELYERVPARGRLASTAHKRRRKSK